MAVLIGSARHDEKGNYTGGAKGDSLQRTAPDKGGEVSMQAFYVHKKGWTIIRPKSPELAAKLSERMKTACNNKNIGYSQSDRYSIIKDGIDTKRPSNCDCSSLVRECVKEASGTDPGDFTTGNAEAVLFRSGLFAVGILYRPGVELRTGDILCTVTKGHIVIVVDGNAPGSGNPYKEPTKDVKLHDKGESVRWLQWELNKRGYRLKEDGDAGNLTIGALIDYQWKHKDFLAVDGVCGMKTRKLLKEGV